jgi:hypothetical protein
MVEAERVVDMLGVALTTTKVSQGLVTTLLLPSPL